jgi:hypothetical protein
LTSAIDALFNITYESLICLGDFRPSAKQSPNKIGHPERNDTHMKTKQSRNVMHSSIRYVQKGNISLHLNKLNQNNYVFKCEIEKCYKRRKGINVFS